MSVGIALSPYGLGAAGNAVDAAVGVARAAAAAGVRSVWAGQTFSYDAVGLMSVVGREVPGIEVGTSAVPITGRHPLLVASQALTAAAATHGRFTLGLALGAEAFAEPVFGVSFERPITRLREFLTVARQVVDTGSADFRGETVTAVTPMPAAVAGADATRMPILVAAMGPQALRVAGELADGTLPYFLSPAGLERHVVAPLVAAAERAGRPRPRVVACVYGAVVPDLDAARARVAESTAFFDRVPSYQRAVALSGATRAAELAVIGDEHAVATAVRDYFAAGATDVVFTGTELAGPAGQERTWKLLGELAGSAPVASVE